MQEQGFGLEAVSKEYYATNPIKSFLVRIKYQLLFYWSTKKKLLFTEIVNCSHAWNLYLHEVDEIKLVQN